MRYALARATWLVTGVFALAGLLAARPAAPQFTSFTHGSRNILEGNWQSCREADGRYSERVYDHVVNGVGRFEVHLGPKRDFAIFKGLQEEHRDHDSAVLVRIHDPAQPAERDGSIGIRRVLRAIHGDSQIAQGTEVRLNRFLQRRRVSSRFDRRTARTSVDRHTTRVRRDTSGAW